MKTNKEILEMFIDNFKEFENKYKALTRYVQSIQEQNEKLEKENQELKDKLELLEKNL